MIPKFAFDTYNPAIAAPFIGSWEGESLTAYPDSIGVWTIGRGHTKDVRPGDTITKEESEQIFIGDLTEKRNELAPYVHVSVTQGQFIALLSLAFNVGVQGLVKYCPKLMEALNSGNVEECARQFLDIDKAGGRRIPGLTRRRRAEADLFLRG